MHVVVVVIQLSSILGPFAITEKAQIHIHLRDQWILKKEILQFSMDSFLNWKFC